MVPVDVVQAKTKMHGSEIVQVLEPVYLQTRLRRADAGRRDWETRFAIQPREATSLTGFPKLYPWAYFRDRRH